MPQNNWIRKALDFVNQTSYLDRNNPAPVILTNSLRHVKQATDASLILHIEFVDEDTARVRGALPESYNEFTITSASLQRVIKSQGSRVVFWEEIPEAGHGLTNILKHIHAVVMLPINTMTIDGVLLIGWEQPMTFNDDFKVCMETISVRLREILEQTRQLNYFRKIAVRYGAILHRVPHALVFINNDGRSGWINEEAAQLLHLATPGDQLTAVISDAMTHLRERALNKEEIYKKAIEVFSKVDVTRDWEWHFPDETLLVSYLPVQMPQISGRLWVFEKKQPIGG